MNEMKWVSAQQRIDEDKVTKLVAHGFGRTMAEMLVMRGIDTPTAVQHFLEDTLADRANPFLMKDLAIAVDRILLAQKQQEKVVVYGDYDVDGITSTSVLLRCFRALGIDCDFYIPDRLREGYGMNAEAMRTIIAQGTTLLITVDCGISAVDLIEQYRTQIDIIVTDHHQPGVELPPALAVVNPHRSDCDYPEKELAGVGVAYTLCRGLWQRVYKKDYTADLELVAFGTIADVMPLLGENRIYVRYGLAACRHTENVGMKALLKACRVPQDGVTAERVGYSLAPRLNAAGRIAHAKLGVELLTATESTVAEEIALLLVDINSERQSMERQVLQEAQARIEELGIATHSALVIDGRDWHSGVIGIVASRLVEKYHRPVVMITVADGVGKGSCRSIPALDMYATLTSAKEHLLQFGGHHQAAGLTVDEEAIPAFREAVEAYATAQLTAEDFLPVLEYERTLDPREITLDFVRFLDRLEPYGLSNPAPLFVTRDMAVNAIRRIGAEQRHVKLRCEKDGTALECVGWGMHEMANEVFAGDRIDIAYGLQLNEWNQQLSIQAVLKDAKLIKADEAVVTPEVLREIYQALRNLLRGKDRRKGQVELLLLEQMHLTHSPRTIAVAMQIFIELGIILPTTEEEVPYYSWGYVADRLDLSTSITYMTHSKEGQTVGSDSSSF